MTNFFKQLELLMGSMELNLVLSKTGEQLTVCIMPKAKVNDEAVQNLLPIVMTGTADELDEGFFQHINKPLERAKGLVSNTEQFEKDLEEREKNTKAAKEKELQEKQAKEAEKKAAERKKKKVKLLVEKATTLQGEKKYREAIGAINEAIKVEGKNTPALEKQFKELVALVSQGQLFGEAEDYSKVETNFGSDIDKQIDKEESGKKPTVVKKPVGSVSNETTKDDTDEDDEDDDDDKTDESQTE